MARRLPLYILIDVSEGMSSDAMKSVNKGLSDCLDSWKKDPVALESLWVSLITIGKQPRQLIPLTELDQVESEFLLAERGTDGASDLGAALRLVSECCEREVVKRTVETRGDWNPVVVVLSGTQPTADISAGAEIFKRLRFGSVVIVRLDKNVDRAIYEQFSSDVYDLDGFSPDVIGRYLFAEQIEAEMADADPETSDTAESDVALPSSPEDAPTFQVPSAMFIRCPKCKESLELPREAVGKKVQCPFCQNVFTGRAEVLLVDFEMPETPKTKVDSMQENTSVAEGVSQEVAVEPNGDAAVYEIIKSVAKEKLKRNLVSLEKVTHGTVFTTYDVEEANETRYKDLSKSKREEFIWELQSRLHKSDIELTRYGIHSVAIPVEPNERLSFWANIAGLEDQIDPVFSSDVNAQYAFWKRCADKGTGGMLDVAWALPYVSGVGVCTSVAHNCGGTQMILGDYGFGKTTCLNAAICTLALFRPAEAVRIVVLDPDGEMPEYRGLPHVYQGTIRGYDNCKQMLKRVCADIERRYQLTLSERIGSIRPEDNVKWMSANKNPVPYVMVFIDNMDTLVRSGDKEMYESLATLSRAWHEGYYSLATAHNYSKSVFKDMRKYSQDISSSNMLFMGIADPRNYNHYSKSELGEAIHFKHPGQICNKTNHAHCGSEATYITDDDVQEVIRIANCGDMKEREYRSKLRSLGIPENT